MTTKEAIEYWERFNAEIDDLYDICSDADRVTLIKQREAVEFTISALRARQGRDRNSTMIVAKLREFASMNPPVCEWDKDNHGPVYCKPYEPWQKTARDAAGIIERYEKGEHSNQKEMQWISVKDRLPSLEGLEPDEVEYVLVSEQYFAVITGEKLGSCVSICGFGHDGWSKSDNFGYVCTENITHWMPMPEPPEED